MTAIKPITILLLALCAIGCTTNNSKKDGELLKIDVTKTYPSKKLVLQDFAEIKYIPIETTDDFLCSNDPRILTQNKIVFTNAKIGEILIFDRSGKAINKINRKGNGAEEYTELYHLVLDKTADELFIIGNPTKIQVYDTKGKYLRTLPIKEDMSYLQLVDFDKDNLFCYLRGDDPNPFILISKLNGEVTHKINIPFDKKIELGITKTIKTGQSYASTRITPISKNENGFILSELSNDTIYQLKTDRSLTPVVVQEPAVQTMKTPIIMEYGPQTNDYVFFSTVKKEFDWSKGVGFPRDFLFLDKNTNEIFEQEIINTDYPSQKYLTLDASFSSERTPSGTGMFWFNTDNLLENLEAGNLQGELKDIASRLKEDDNGVVMLVTLK